MATLCIEKCKFRKWVPGKMFCDLYEQDLQYLKVEENLIFLRCKECELEDQEYHETNKVR